MTPRALGCLLLSACLLGGVPLRAEDPTATAVSLVEKLGGKITRADKSPSSPIIKVDLSDTKVENADLATLKALSALPEHDCIWCGPGLSSTSRA
jgi:hypothetical protein